MMWPRCSLEVRQWRDGYSSKKQGFLLAVLPLLVWTVGTLILFFNWLLRSSPALCRNNIPGQIRPRNQKPVAVWLAQHLVNYGNTMPGFLAGFCYICLCCKEAPAVFLILASSGLETFPQPAGFTVRADSFIGSCAQLIYGVYAAHYLLI